MGHDFEPGNRVHNVEGHRGTVVQITDSPNYPIRVWMDKARQTFDWSPGVLTRLDEGPAADFTLEQIANARVVLVVDEANDYRWSSDLDAADVANGLERIVRSMRRQLAENGPDEDLDAPVTPNAAVLALMEGDKPAKAKLPEGTTLRVSGRKGPLPWGGEGYCVVAETPHPETKSMSSRVVGYVEKAGREDKAWLVRDTTGYLVVSRAPLQNDSRAAALWLAEQAEWPVR